MYILKSTITGALHARGIVRLHTAAQTVVVLASCWLLLDYYYRCTAVLYKSAVVVVTVFFSQQRGRECTLYAAVYAYRPAV